MITPEGKMRITADIDPNIVERFKLYFPSVPFSSIVKDMLKAAVEEMERYHLEKISCGKN
jgi:hypothetical protein